MDKLGHGLNYVASEGDTIEKVEENVSIMFNMSQALQSLSGKEFAVIAIRGKQYKVTRKGDQIKLSKYIDNQI